MDEHPKREKTKLEAPNAYVLPEDDVHPEKTSKRGSQKLMSEGKVRVASPTNISISVLGARRFLRF